MSVFWVLLGFIGCYWVLLGFIRFYWVFKGFHGFWRDLNRFFYVLLGYTCKKKTYKKETHGVSKKNSQRHSFRSDRIKFSFRNAAGRALLRGRPVRHGQRQRGQQRQRGPGQLRPQVLPRRPRHGRQDVPAGRRRLRLRRRLPQRERRAGWRRRLPRRRRLASALLGPAAARSRRLSGGCGPLDVLHRYRVVTEFFFGQTSSTSYRPDSCTCRSTRSTSASSATTASKTSWSTTTVWCVPFGSLAGHSTLTSNRIAIGKNEGAPSADLSGHVVAAAWVVRRRRRRLPLLPVPDVRVGRLSGGHLRRVRAAGRAAQRPRRGHHVLRVVAGRHLRLPRRHSTGTATRPSRLRLARCVQQTGRLQLYWLLLAFT